MKLVRFFNDIGDRVALWLNNSSRIHVRASPVQDLEELVSLIDRFVDDNVRYPLEWDDFVSWPHKDPRIETARRIFEDSERLLFSTVCDERKKYIQILLNERNKVAQLINLPARIPPDQ